MRKSIVFAVLGATLTALVGCGSAGLGTSTAEVDRTAYLTGLDRGGVPYSDDDTAVALGQSTCTQLDAGASFLSVAFTVMSTDLAPEHAGYLVGTAVAVYCPQHISAIEAAGE